MNRVIQVLLLVAAVIHLLPLPGVFGAEMLERLYGVPMREPVVLALMRHRAVLFGIVGGLLGVAVWREEVRTVATAVGLVSAVSFLLIAGASEPLRRVVIADVVAVACLVGVAVLGARG